MAGFGSEAAGLWADGQGFGSGGPNRKRQRQDEPTERRTKLRPWDSVAAQVGDVCMA